MVVYSGEKSYVRFDVMILVRFCDLKVSYNYLKFLVSNTVKQFIQDKTLKNKRKKDFFYFILCMSKCSIIMI